MKKIKAWLRKNTLFLKIVCIFFVSIIAVSSFLSIFIVKMSESSYVQTYSHSTDILLNQISNEYYRLHEDVIETLETCNKNTTCKVYLTSKDVEAKEESIAAYSLASLFEGSGLLTNNTSSNLLLVGLNGKTYVNNAATRRMDAEEILASKVVQFALAHPDEVIYQFSKDQFTTSITQGDAIVAIKVLKNVDRKPYGVSIVILNQKEFKGFYDRLVDTNVNTVKIVNEQGVIISSNRPSLVGKVDQALLGKVQEKIKLNETNYEHYEKGKGKVTTIIKKMPYYDSYLISEINHSVFMSSVSQFPMILGISLLAIILVIVVVFFLIRKAMQPVRTLSQIMPEITNGNFNKHIEVSGTGEVRDLSIAFNYMLDGLNEYIEKLMKLQEEKRLSEIHALQMQINPHFIYNTLTSIKFMVWQGNKEKLIQTIDSFIQLLRNTLSDSDEVVSVEREIENVKNYVQIQTTRYGEKVSVHYFIQNECFQYAVIKTILQPFIENAFFHAFNDLEKGTIDVFGKVKDNKLIFEIIDNGSGIEQQIVKEMMNTSEEKGKHFSGIGIHNVNDRIQLLYGKEYGVILTSVLEQGTIITMTLPLIEKE